MQTTKTSAPEESGTDIVTVSTKGQIVLPKALRVEAGIRENDKLICARFGDTLLLKKLQTDALKREFDEISRAVRQQLKRVPSEEEVVRIVRRHRDASRS